MAPRRLPLGSRALDATLRTLALAAKVHPYARRGELITDRDIPYSGEQSLDVTRPRATGARRPVVLYVHGGGFRILSKDTHWMMARAFALRGYVVVSIDYRLAPAHPFPAALIDVVAAWRWTHAHVADFGGDPTRIVLAGESAGANLVTAAAVARCFDRAEPFAADLRDLPLSAVVPLCGILDVTRPERFPSGTAWVRERIALVCRSYAPSATEGDLASPLRALESDASPVIPLPPFWSSVGLEDPILDDTVRLEKALQKRAVTHEISYCEAQPHAFQALFWRKQTKLAWSRCGDFLAAHV